MNPAAVLIICLILAVIIFFIYPAVKPYKCKKCRIYMKKELDKDNQFVAKCPQCGSSVEISVYIDNSD